MFARLKLIAIKTSDNLLLLAYDISGPWVLYYYRQTDRDIDRNKLRDRSSLFEYCSQVLYSMDLSNCEQNQNRKSLRSLFQIYGVSSLSVNFHEFLED